METQGQLSLEMGSAIFHLQSYIYVPTARERMYVYTAAEEGKVAEGPTLGYGDEEAE